MNYRKKRGLAILFMTLAFLFTGLMIYGTTLKHKAVILWFAGLAVLFLIASVVFLLLYQSDKARIKSKNSLPRKTIEDIVFSLKPDTRLSDEEYWSTFLDWWVACTIDENKIKTNPLLLGAERIMCLDNEVNNGGFDQFWDYAEDWDMEQTLKLFQQFLPKQVLAVYEKAYKAHQNGKDCEQYNEEYDYKLMSQRVLPELAKKVIDFYRYKHSENENIGKGE